MFAQSDNASFIDHEAKSAGAVAAEPEKLGIRRTPFQCVQVSRMEKLKLPAACWIKAMLNHESAPTEDATNVVARNAVIEITEAKEKASSVWQST